MPPTIRTIVDAAGDITAIETYQGPRGWVPITVAQEGPVIQRRAFKFTVAALDEMALDGLSNKEKKLRVIAINRLNRFVNDV